MNLYFAYGMNTNLEEMRQRCPKALNCGHAVIEDYRLAFRGVADFEYQENYNLHGVLWLITEDCEKALDKLEGYPTLYDKHYMTAKVIKSKMISIPEHIELPIMIYKMFDDTFNPPFKYYYDCLKNGYKANNLPMKQLERAKNYSVQHSKKITYLLEAK